MKTPHEKAGLGAAIGDLIKRAAADAGFRMRLLTARSRAAVDLGIALHPAEQRLLDTYPADQLTCMIDNLRVAGSDRRTFLKTAAIVAAATISAGLAGKAVAGENDTKTTPGAPKDEKNDPLLTQLKNINAQLAEVRKKMQKEAAAAVAVEARRKSETEEVPRERPMAVMGMMAPPTYRTRTKTKEEQVRDQEALKRAEALEAVLTEIQLEAEAAQIEIKTAKKTLTDK